MVRIPNNYTVWSRRWRSGACRGKSVEKTERISFEEVDEIIWVLSLNPGFVSAVQSYVNTLKKTDVSLSDEEDSEMHAKITSYIDELIEGRNLRLRTHNQ